MSVKGGPIGKIVNGSLDLTGTGITNLSFLGVQPTLKVLILNENKISNFDSLAPQPNLIKIIAKYNPIKYLDGLNKQESLEELNISGSEIAGDNQFKARVYATTGQRLKIINGQEVTEKEQATGKQIYNKRFDLLYLSPKASKEIFQVEEIERLQYRKYVEVHKEQFPATAMNEAILWDLTTNGPVPYIDELSTARDLKLAILNLRKRNAKINETFNPK